MKHLKTEPRYNIITGQQLSGHLISAQRSFSTNQSLQKVQKVQALANQADLKSYRRNSTLGKPKDHKQFQYSYDLQVSQPTSANRVILPQVITFRQKSAFSRIDASNFHPTMNHVSVPYNFINYSDQLPTATIIDKSAFNGQIMQANRKNPLTKIIDDSNMFKSNFHMGYEDKVNQNIFRRKKQICGNICNVEKGYGFSKYFRKFK